MVVRRVRRMGGAVIVRCWQCGNDHEVSDAPAREAERQRIIRALEQEATYLGVRGDIFGHGALMRAIESIESL